MTTTENIPNRYRKERECVKRCKEFDDRLKNIEDVIKKEYECFNNEIKRVAKRLDENIACNKEFQKECQEEIEATMAKIEKSKKEIKRLKRLSIINICFFVLCLIICYAGL